MEVIKGYIDQLQFGVIGFVVECLILVLALALFIYFVAKHVTSKLTIGCYFANLALFIVCFVLNLKIGYLICIVMFILLAIYSFIHYIPTIKEQKNQSCRKPSK